MENNARCIALTSAFWQRVSTVAVSWTELNRPPHPTVTSRPLTQPNPIKIESGLVGSGQVESDGIPVFRAAANA